MLIDTHCHIYDEVYDADRAETIARAQAVGVQWVLMPAVDAESLPRLLQVEAEYPDFCRAAIGLHPTSVSTDWEKDVAFVHTELQRRPWTAVGEIGIDLYWDKTLAIEQEKAFRQQVEWAIEFDLPILIHTRKAFDETWRILAEYKCDRLRGIFHCFSGSSETAERIAQLGNFYLGIGGVLTFKNAGLPAALAQVPLSRIVLETDAPYLAPTPHRGTRNESAYLPLIVQKMSEIYQCDKKEVEQVSSANAGRLFKTQKK